MEWLCGSFNKCAKTYPCLTMGRMLLLFPYTNGKIVQTKEKIFRRTSLLSMPGKVFGKILTKWAKFWNCSVAFYQAGAVPTRLLLFTRSLRNINVKKLVHSICWFRESIKWIGLYCGMMHVWRLVAKRDKNHLWCMHTLRLGDSHLIVYG